jgi:hypothetical protein
MLLSFVYLFVRRVARLLIPGDEFVRSAEVELLVLRHEVKVLRRQVRRPACTRTGSSSPPAGRFGMPRPGCCSCGYGGCAPGSSPAPGASRAGGGGGVRRCPRRAVRRPHDRPGAQAGTEPARLPARPPAGPGLGRPGGSPSGRASARPWLHPVRPPHRPRPGRRFFGLLRERRGRSGGSAPASPPPQRRSTRPG